MRGCACRGAAGFAHVSCLEAHNLASSFISLERFEARSLMRKTIPVAQRVAGEDAEVTLRMRWRYAEATSNRGGRHVVVAESFSSFSSSSFCADFEDDGADDDEDDDDDNDDDERARAATRFRHEEAAARL